MGNLFYDEGPAERAAIAEGSLPRDCTGQVIRVGSWVRRLEIYNTSTFRRYGFGPFRVMGVTDGDVVLCVHGDTEETTWDAYRFEVVEAPNG